MKRIPMTISEEYDALTCWRRELCYLKKPGATSWIKRHYRRRERRVGKDEIRKAERRD